MADVSISAAIVDCLEQVDVSRMRRLHAEAFKHLPPLGSDHDVLVSIHHARTQAEGVTLKARAWSHRWLLDHGYPSALPDHLKPKAERLYPRVVEATGFAWMGKISRIVPLAMAVHAAVEEVILDEYSGRVVKHDRLRDRILETKDRTIRRELGRGIDLLRRE